MEPQNLSSADIQTLVARHETHLGMLKRITRLLARREPLSEILPVVLDVICEPVNAVGARVVLADADNTSFGGGSKANALAQADDNLWAFGEQAVVIKQLEDAPETFDLRSVSGSVTALVILPLIAGDDHQGVLWLGFDRVYDLTEDQYSFLELAATQIAGHINNDARPGVTLSGINVAKILAGSGDALIVVDNDGYIQLANTVAQELFGFDEASYGQSYNALVEDEQLGALLRDAATDVDEGHNVYYFTDDDRTFQPSVSSIISQNGLQLGLLLVLWEITRFKRINENMSMFLHTVSHDLRSPLTAAKGYLDMLGMVGDVNDTQASMIGKILTSIDDMTNLVEKVLDAGRLDPEMGTYELRREPTDLSTIIDKVVSTLATTAAQKSIELRTDIAPNLPIMNVDPMMIERALINLVENAIKYTPEGSSVTFGGLLEQDQVILYVQDDGPGIPAEHQDRLFQKGERLIKKGERKVRGSGLGLYIVKNVALQHGGDAIVTSERGNGSRFMITIPLVGHNLVGASTTEE